MTDLFSQPEFSVHIHETGKGNQKILNANRKKFSRQCQILFDAMMRGERLTSFDCAMKYKILDGRRRFCDLEMNGVRISEKLINTGFKEKFFTEEDKIHNQQLINQNNG